MRHANLQKILDAIQQETGADIDLRVQAVSGILATVIASMHAGTEAALLHHVCRFSEDQIRQIDARN